MKMKYFVIIVLAYVLIIQNSMALDLPQKIYDYQIATTRCDYFLDDNSIALLEDIYTFLKIPEKDLNNKSQKIDKEFFSKYSDCICDLDYFLIDLNTTADMRLTFNQIDELKMAILSVNSDMKDIIIKPDRPLFVYSTFDRILSSFIPRNELTGGQSAPYLLGKTEVVLIFINNPGVTWSNEINNVFSKVLDATTWLESQSPTNANSDFEIVYYIANIDYDANNCDLNDGFCACNSWMEDAVKNLGASDNNNDNRYTDDLVNFIKSNTQADNVALTYIIKESPLFSSVAGYACPYPFFGVGERTAVYYKTCFIACQTNGMDVYAHELLHLFGACDEYQGCGEFYGCNNPCIFSYTPVYDKYPNANCYDCNLNGQPCIMRGEDGLGASAPELAIEYYTKGQIGWGDYDNDNVIDPKDLCPLIFGNGFDGCLTSVTTTTDNACATDVYQCSDGSYVSRNPSNSCQFYPCPNATSTDIITICERNTTNCAKSCKKCPSNYEYCEYEWTSKCGNSSGVLYPGESLPWLTCNKISNCTLKGKPTGSTTVTTTTTTIQAGCVEICNKQTTNCQLSCKKCPSNYEYCEYEWISSCNSINGTINSGQSLPWLTCNKKSNCAVRGCD